MTYKSNAVDNIIALRLLTILCTPFEEFPAYKAGIIDNKGKYIVPVGKRTQEQKRNLTYLDRLMINVKKMINKLPGGENKLKNIVSAMILVKESYQQHTPVEMLTENQLTDIVNGYNTGDIRYQEIIRLWCDYIKQKEIREEIGVGAIDGGQGQPPTNNTSGIAMTQLPLGAKSAIARRKPHNAILGTISLDPNKDA